MNVVDRPLSQHFANLVQNEKATVALMLWARPTSSLSGAPEASCPPVQRQTRRVSTHAVRPLKGIRGRARTRASRVR